MQRWALIVIVAATVLLGGCARGSGFFRDRDERTEAARLLQQRQAIASTAPKTTLPHAVKRYLSALDKFAATRTENAHEVSVCAFLEGSNSLETIKLWNECIDKRFDRKRLIQLVLNVNADGADAAAAFRLLPPAVQSLLVNASGEKIKEVQRTDDTVKTAYQYKEEARLAYNAAQSAYKDNAALNAYKAAAPNADGAAAVLASARRVVETNRSWADAAVESAYAVRAYTAVVRVAVEDFYAGTKHMGDMQTGR